MSTTLIEVRPARAADASAIASTHDDAWRSAYQGLIPGAEPCVGGAMHLVEDGLAETFWSVWKQEMTAGAYEACWVPVETEHGTFAAVTFVADDPDLAGTMTMSWEITATDDGTRVDIRADHVPAGISAEDHAAGLMSSLANLADYLHRP